MRAIILVLAISLHVGCAFPEARRMDFALVLLGRLRGTFSRDDQRDLCPLTGLSPAKI